MKTKNKLIASALLLGLGAISGDALACGGGIFLQSSSTVTASGHRVALSLSSTQTVLWDQIEYSGNPSDFAWVYPVKKGAYLEVGANAFFEVLEAGSTAIIDSPYVECGGGDDSGGCACGGLGGASDKGFGGPNGDNAGVEVVHRGTVGPFETVTLATDTGAGTLATWLQTNGYAIPADISPILDQYVSEGFDFIAVKLKPDQGVDAMQPLRIVSPGATWTFPMRMLSAGAGDTMNLVLYVLSEGRVEVSGFKNAVIPTDQLVFDFGTDTSNYDTLRDGIFKADANTFVTVMSTPNELLRMDRGVSFPGDFGSVSVARAYLRQGSLNGETTSDCINARAGLDSIVNSKDKVVDLCPDPMNPTNCATLGANEIDSATLACEGLDDLSVALTGMHPTDVWFTRLEARLPKASLASDLTITPVASGAVVPRAVEAQKVANSPCATTEASVSRTRPVRGAAALLMVSLGALVAFARRSSKRADRPRG